MITVNKLHKKSVVECQFKSAKRKQSELNNVKMNELQKKSTFELINLACVHETKINKTKANTQTKVNTQIKVRTQKTLKLTIKALL